jgi:hypothetical protein
MRRKMKPYQLEVGFKRLYSFFSCKTRYTVFVLIEIQKKKEVILQVI